MGRHKENLLQEDSFANHSNLTVYQLHDLKKEIAENLKRDGFKDFTIKHEKGYIIVQLPSAHLKLLPSDTISVAALRGPGYPWTVLFNKEKPVYYDKVTTINGQRS